MVLGFAFCLAMALGYRDLRVVRSDLVAARSALVGAITSPSGLQTPESRAATEAQVAAAIRSVDNARQRVTSSGVLSAARLVPGLRQQRAGILRLIDDSATAASTGQGLLTEIDGLAGQTQVHGGVVPLDAVRRLEVDAKSAATTLRPLSRPGSGLWGPLGDARRRFDRLATTSADRLARGADALGAAQTFMGGTGPRRYLVTLENNAEMRDQGAILSYVLVSFDAGHLTFGRSGSVADLALDRPVPTPVPPGTNAVFGPIHPTELWQSVNGTADFAWSSQVVSQMYRQATGTSIDGVIAIDVPGLAFLLEAVGPVAVSGIPEPVSAGNVARVVLHDLYQGLAPSSAQGPRKERLSEVTKAVIDRLTHTAPDVAHLGRDLAQAAVGGHFRVWSADVNEQGVFEHTGLGGQPAAIEADRTFHLAIENRTATKLDYYVQASMRAEVRVQPNGDAIVHSFIVVDNQAPVGASPSYQLGPDANTAHPGDYIAWVLLWGPAGSTQAGSVSESGLQLSQAVANLSAGQRLQIEFQTVVPHAVRNGQLMLRFVPQPRLQPAALDIRLVGVTGWRVSGPVLWQGTWDQVRTVSWPLRR